MRHPTWDDLRRFCEVDGWEATHEDRGRKRRDHDRYRRSLSDGRILRTKASHGNIEIGDPKLVRRIWRYQLEVTEEQFWDAVDNGVAPSREAEDTTDDLLGEEPAHDLEDWLAVFLAMNVGLSDNEIAALDPAAAMQRYLEWCEQQP